MKNAKIIEHVENAVKNMKDLCGDSLSEIDSIDDDTNEVNALITRMRYINAISLMLQSCLEETISVTCSKADKVFLESMFSVIGELTEDFTG